MSVRVVVADDEELVRFGLSAILNSDPHINVVAEACNGAEAIQLTHAHRPDVVLMDIRMPVMDGVRATREITRLQQPAKVVVLTTFNLDEYVNGALRAGATGFLLKNSPPADLTRAVKTVHEGEAMLAPAVTRRLIAEFAARDDSKLADAQRRVTGLTTREREVLCLLAHGLSNNEIATTLHMSASTVKAYVSRVLGKLRCANRVQAALVAHHAGLIQADWTGTEGA
ncbi:response regulator transcription factor [Streptomyces lavendulocolor]|uniref:response regulator transcription factor n=1 Tax=Streptomyces lavendulocolor TaxID=67316 RepID=UPI0033FEF7D3